MKYPKINPNSTVPKYKQIIQLIEEDIEKGKYSQGDKLPSINELIKVHSVSRDTILSAYNNLKIRGIIKSVSGKGYFFNNLDINITQKVFLLFDELNAFKEDLYQSFISGLKSDISVDPFFHHFNPKFFNDLITNSVGNYHKYIIMPANLENSHEVISQLPEEKVFILDQITPELTKYSSIYQNIEKDLFKCLMNAIKSIRKYQNIVLVFDEKQPTGMKNALTKFSKIVGIPVEIINSTKNINPCLGDLFLIPDDKSLVQIIKKIKKERLRIGTDVGIIAINDTLLKEILEDGITTITTNFGRMGKELAKMINSGKHLHIENPIELIDRKSL